MQPESDAYIADALAAITKLVSLSDESLNTKAPQKFDRPKFQAMVVVNKYQPRL